MKYILLLLFLFINSYSDEIQRIESIVKDIENLRKKYEIVQEELILKKENNDKLNKKIVTLEKQIKIYKKQLKNKEKELKSKKKNHKKEICKVKKVKQKIIYKIKKSEKSNKFPKLMLKPEYVKYIKKGMKAKTYHLKEDAYIYSKINVKKIELWKRGAMFTSNEKAVAKNYDSWMRITGYFIKNEWVPSKIKMWVKAKYIK